jgi:hypothetical protein
MTFCMHEYILAPESISTASFINLSHHSVCLYVYSVLLLGNGSVKILSLLGNGSAKMLPPQQTHRLEYINCWTRRFLCGTCHIKESRRLILPRTPCCSIYLIATLHRPTTLILVQFCAASGHLLSDRSRLVSFKYLQLTCVRIVTFC